LTGEIIDAKRAMGAMRKVVSELRDAEILVISAYVTVDGLRELLAEVSPTNRVRVLARWQPGDLACGASDLASFDFAHARGWEFYTSQALHAKAFVLGQGAIYIGSANLTRRGFSVGGNDGNIEILTRVPVELRNVELLQDMFIGAVQLDEDLVEQVRAWLKDHAYAQGSAANSSPTWPLLAREAALQQAVTRLTVSECFLTDGSWTGKAGGEKAAFDAERRHDLSLLALTELEEHGGVARALRRTRMLQWLEHELNAVEDGQLYFGAITAKLHEALIDDPRPYRRDVKTLLANLLSWIKQYPECGLQVDRPGYSERVRLGVRA
jgi:hypothetical protein